VRVRIPGKKIFVLAPAVACAFALSAVTPATAAELAPASSGVGSSDVGSVGALGPLTDLVIARLDIGDLVAASKFGTGKPIDDPVREQQIRDQVRQRAIALGIDPDATVRFFDDQIEANKVVQRGLFAFWTAHPDQAPTSRPDLTQIRGQLDQLTTELLNELVATVGVRQHTPVCVAQLALARVSGEVAHHLDALHRQALGGALESVCAPA
jgi:chorismate mutase